MYISFVEAKEAVQRQQMKEKEKLLAFRSDVCIFLKI